MQSTFSLKWSNTPSRVGGVHGFHILHNLTVTKYWGSINHSFSTASTLNMKYNMNYSWKYAFLICLFLLFSFLLKVYKRNIERVIFEIFEVHLPHSKKRNMRGPSVLLRCSMFDQEVGGWRWIIQMIFSLCTHRSPAAVLGVLLKTVNHRRQKTKSKDNALMNRKQSSDNTATESSYPLSSPQ